MVVFPLIFCLVSTAMDALLDKFQEVFPVPIILEDGFTFFAPVSDAITRPRMLKAKLSGRDQPLAGMRK